MRMITLGMSMGFDSPPANNELLTNLKIRIMPVLTEQHQNEVAERNAQIAERFTTLSENQPLATANKIMCYLASEYNLTAQYIGRILREQGIIPTTQPLNSIKL